VLSCLTTNPTRPDDFVAQAHLRRISGHKLVTFLSLNYTLLIAKSALQFMHLEALDLSSFPAKKDLKKHPW
jgi:hypothetical protein